ncbi:MAG TPA: hypothetical protein PLT27_04255 [Nitrospira sp.]|nr:hypothetical protein [Nitrospira sp.]
MRSVHAACWYQNRPQDAHKGRPARPQRAKWRIVLLPYGEPLSDARTPLADFFRILQVHGRLFFEHERRLQGMADWEGPKRKWWQPMGTADEGG